MWGVLSLKTTKNMEMKKWNRARAKQTWLTNSEQQHIKYE